MSLDAYLSDLKSLESTLENEIDKVIKEKQGFLVGLIKNRLFQKGIDGSGNKILPDYKPSTIKIKKEKHQRTSHVTLRDTGDFYRGIFVEFKNSSVISGSIDGKTDSLIDKYGKNILGFTKDEQDVIIFGIVEPIIQKIINNLERKLIELNK